MDTSPDMSGKDVKPWIVHQYDGKDIVLNEQLNIKEHLVKEEFNGSYCYSGDIIITDFDNWIRERM